MEKFKRGDIVTHVTNPTLKMVVYAIDEFVTSPDIVYVSWVTKKGLKNAKTSADFLYKWATI